MSKWTANCLPGVLKRTPEYAAYIRKQDWKKANIIRIHNERLEASRLLNATQGLQTLAPAPDSSHLNQKESGPVRSVAEPQQ